MAIETLRMPLHQQAKEVIEKEILEGKYKLGEILTTEDAIMSRFGISRNTARRTLATLDQQGYVKRKKRLGTVLVSSVRKKEENVGVLFMQTYGHLYDPLSKRIISAFSNGGYHLFVQDSDGEAVERDFFSVLSFRPSFLVFDGSTTLFPLLEKTSYDGLLVFILHYEKEKKLPGAYVLHDHLAGVRLQVDHLLNSGYENIIYSTHPVLPGHVISKEKLTTVTEHLTTRCFKGRYQHLVSDRVPSNRIEVERMVETLRGLGKNTGVMCVQDTSARYVYQAADILGWNIPEDVGIVGYYNTPWTTLFHPGLTSVSVNEKAIADNVFQIIAECIPKEIYIQPELVLRESTRPAASDQDSPNTGGATEHTQGSRKEHSETESN